MEEKAKMCIITVGYNRPDSMQRLLASLLEADYRGDTVDLLISIDKGQRQKEIIEVAQNFVWKYGYKKIRAFSVRQGLRPHIIQCGDMTEEYEAVIILEDDITVSECFYQYAKQAVNFYRNDKRIGGISLYKHEINVGVGRFFQPEYNGFDTYLMQYAQSWGQCWTTEMWKGFKQWYTEKNESYFTDLSNPILRYIPQNVLDWDSHSWLKYFMAYIVEKDLYFVYPYQSLTTNHSEVGQHNVVGISSDYEVALATGKWKYEFPKFEDAVRYDVFFERCSYCTKGYEDKKVIFDLYGNKKEFGNGDIAVSSQALPFKVLEGWKLTYRPQEVNCKLPQKGNDFWVYDLHMKDNENKRIKRVSRTKYDVRSTNWRFLLELGTKELKEACLRKFQRK